jgi:hypothetical protein
MRASFFIKPHGHTCPQRIHPRLTHNVCECHSSLLNPNHSAYESWASTLFFINSQSNAAAQVCAGGPAASQGAGKIGRDDLLANPIEIGTRPGANVRRPPNCVPCLHHPVQATALALGNTHSAALLVPTLNSDGDHNLYTFGRGASLHCLNLLRN